MAVGGLVVNTEPEGGHFYLINSSGDIVLHMVAPFSTVVDEGYYSYCVIDREVEPGHPNPCDPYYSPIRGTVQIVADETRVLNINMETGGEEPSTGTLSVQTTPSGAQFYLYNRDGSIVSGFPKTTPFSVEVPTGDYDYIISKEGYLDKTGFTIIYPGVTTHINETLTTSSGGGGSEETENTGILIINSVPQGARIYIDDVYTGYATNSIINLPPGTYTIRLEKEFYKPYLLPDVVVNEGVETTVNVNLELDILKIAALPLGILGAYFVIDSLQKEKKR